ncbi:MAG: hypothetical protein JRD89_04790 [Deltaproteobacteria bacterium]|nr:hypothetical protein [Deltaproteobacteria bacterium]
MVEEHRGIIILDFEKRPDESLKQVEGKEFWVSCQYSDDSKKISCFLERVGKPMEQYGFKTTDLIGEGRIYFSPSGFMMRRAKIYRSDYLGEIVIKEVK